MPPAYRFGCGPHVSWIIARIMIAMPREAIAIVISALPRRRRRR